MPWPPRVFLTELNSEAPEILLPLESLTSASSLFTQVKQQIRGVPMVEASASRNWYSALTGLREGSLTCFVQAPRFLKQL